MEGEIWGPTLRQRTAGNQQLPGEGELVSPRDKALIGQQVVSPEIIYTQADSACCVYIFMHVDIYVAITKTKAIDL